MSAPEGQTGFAKFLRKSVDKLLSKENVDLPSAAKDRGIVSRIPQFLSVSLINDSTSIFPLL
jgi:hypothetical protein